MKINTQNNSYEITFDRGGISRARQIFNLDRKVLIVSDDGVPKEYADAVASQCKEPYVSIIPQGEESKCLDSFKRLLREMLREGFTRFDCVVAVGGGVVGDLAGFVAASFMRGVDFYNIPTTLLAQVDASIGGKTAIDFEGHKNVVGAFYQPKGVLIDADVLKTLEPRLILEGLAEAVKMAATCDAEFFKDIESYALEIGDIIEGTGKIDEIIKRSIAIKKNIVEQDEREAGLRKVLNFGHTIGHAIEMSGSGLYHGECVAIGSGLYHGECVAIGMLFMCAPEVRERLEAVLQCLGLPTEAKVDKEAIIQALRHDKKRDGDKITCVYVPEIGRFEFRDMTVEEIAALI